MKKKLNLTQQQLEKVIMESAIRLARNPKMLNEVMNQGSGYAPMANTQPAQQPSQNALNNGGVLQQYQAPNYANYQFQPNANNNLGTNTDNVNDANYQTLQKLMVRVQKAEQILARLRQKVGMPN